MAAQQFARLRPLRRVENVLDRLILWFICEVFRSFNIWGMGLPLQQDQVGSSWDCGYDDIMFEFDWKSANPSFQQVDTGHHDANRFFVDKCVYRLNPSTCGVLSRNLNMYDHVLYVYRHINIDTIYSNILCIYIFDLRSTCKLV